MKLTVKLKNPLASNQEVKKTFTIRGKKHTYYAQQLLKMSNEGMMIVPIDLTVSIDGVDHDTTVILSTPANKKGYRGLINQKPIEKENTSVIESKDEPRIPWWRKIVR